MKGIASIALIGILSLVVAGTIVASGGINTERFVNATATSTIPSEMSVLNLDTGEHIPLDSDPRAIKNFMEDSGQKVVVSTDNKTLLSQITEENIVDPEVMSTQKTVKMEYDTETGQKIVVPYNYDSNELREIAKNEDVLTAIRETPQVDTSKYSLLNLATGDYVRLDSDDEILETFKKSATDKGEDLVIARSTEEDTLDLLSHSYDVRQQVESLKTSELSDVVKKKGIVGEDSVSGQSFFTGPQELLEDVDLVSSGSLNAAIEDSLSGIEAVAQAREADLASSVSSGLNIQGMVDNVIRQLMWAGAIGALIFVLWKFIVPYLISYVSAKGRGVRHTKEVDKTRGAGASVAKDKGKSMGASTLESVLLAKPTDTLVELGPNQTVEVSFDNVSDVALKNVEVTTSTASEYIGTLKAGDETTVRIEIPKVNSNTKSTKVSVSFTPVKIGGRTFRKHNFTVPLKVVKLAEEEESETEEPSENCAFHKDREAVAKCVKCGKLLCEDCAKEKKGKIYCPDHA